MDANPIPDLETIHADVVSTAPLELNLAVTCAMPVVLPFFKHFDAAASTTSSKGLGCQPRWKPLGCHCTWTCVSAPATAAAVALPPASVPASVALPPAFLPAFLLDSLVWLFVCLFVVLVWILTDLLACLHPSSRTWILSCVCVRVPCKHTWLLARARTRVHATAHQHDRATASICAKTTNACHNHHQQRGMLETQRQQTLHGLLTLCLCRAAVSATHGTVVPFVYF